MPTSIIELNEELTQLVVVNTHRGLFHYNRLLFGIALAPVIFQQTMKSILHSMEHVCIYIDDILVSREIESKHLFNLDQVFARLESS